MTGVTLLSFSATSSAAVVLPHGPGDYTGGCNFLPPGATSIGPFGSAIATAHVATQNRTTHLWAKNGSDWSWARSPTHSAYVQQTMFWVVGPPNGSGLGGTPPGCLDPMHNRTAQTATYEWNLTYRAYVAANCTGLRNATASATLNLLANVHLARPPFYVFPVAPLMTLWTHTLHCSRAASGNVHTGLLNFTTPPFNLTKGTTYDFYSGVSTAVSATATGNATAFAGITIARAALVRVSCTC